MSEVVNIRVSMKHIEDIRKLRPAFEHVPAKYIVDIILQKWIEQETLEEPVK